jgi:hypothetical protein
MLAQLIIEENKKNHSEYTFLLIRDEWKAELGRENSYMHIIINEALKLMKKIPQKRT